MTNPKPKNTPSPAQSEKKAQINKEANAQRDLMGDAAVDPQPLLDEEQDPIAQKAQTLSETD